MSFRGHPVMQREENNVDTSLDHFDEDDLAVLASLREADEGAGTDANGQASNQQAAAQQGAQGEQGAQATAASTSTESTDPAADASNQIANQEGEVKTGNVNAALRASRRSEKRALEKAERLERENEELRSKIPSAVDADGGIDESLAADFPEVAAALKKRDQQIAELNERLKQTPQGNQVTQNQEFIPPELPLDVQEIVDEIPDLLDLQHNPDQTGWRLAVGFDAALNAHPVWSTKTPAQRFAEATRRAKAELSTTNTTSTTDTSRKTAADPVAAAQEVVAKAPRQQPNTLSDFGGSATEPEGSNLSRFARMSDDDITNELLRGG